MSEQRLVLVHQILSLKRPVSQVAREFGISRKTAYKWTGRYEADGAAQSLVDRSRRPKRSPKRTAESLEQQVLAIRWQYNWGPRKIHRHLSDQQQPQPQQQQQQQQQDQQPRLLTTTTTTPPPPQPMPLPSIRTVAAILSRHNCVPAAESAPPQQSPPPQLFERSVANELWQLDHKGPVEVARQRVTPLTVIDDYSRYCLCFTPLLDVTMRSAWRVLWDVFGEVGLPESILCDRAFAGSIGLSWFDARLVRLGIRPVHGRPYHPQTQGKVERLHGSAQRELINFNARRDSLEHFAEDALRWRIIYNTLRPHEALGDLPPIGRWRPSPRPRPARLPAEVEYPPCSIVRRVSEAGDCRYRNARIVVGRALAGQTVRIEPRERDLAVYYAWKLLRIVPNDQLPAGRSDKIV